MGERSGALRTARLDLVPATIALLEDELASAARLGAHLGACVTPLWPPGQHDRDAVAFFLARSREGGEPARGWYAWYIVLRGEAGAPDTLAGSIGYFGPPREGVVEIGYSVVESFRRRGIAAEAIGAMTARALVVPGVGSVIAHTAADNEPSRLALRRAGFRDVGPGPEAGTRRYERGRSRG